jgi:hypothetical protein
MVQDLGLSGFFKSTQNTVSPPMVCFSMLTMVPRHREKIKGIPLKSSGYKAEYFFQNDRQPDGERPAVHRCNENGNRHQIIITLIG